MKWTYLIQQKLKASLVLTFLMAAVALTAYLEQRNAAAMNQSFASIYYDRLIPATDIFYLTENLYQKRLLMDDFLHSSDQVLAEVQHKLTANNQRVAQRIEQFEKTYLVEQESYYLAQFKKNILHYEQVEKEILQLAAHSPARALQLYEHQGKADLDQTIYYLNKLTSIQSNVGRDLIKNSNVLLSKTEVLSNVQIALAIVLGTLVIALVVSSKLPMAQQPFHLN